MSISCWPWFSAEYRALAAQPWTQTVIKAGAAVDGNGNIPIPPETLRARAEAALPPQALAMIGGRLSLDTYSYARYMASEALGNSSTVEERVAVGEALRNKSFLGRSISKLLTPSGYYGPIHGPGGYETAPYGRWAATTRDPSVMTIMLAHLVTSGASGDFARGANDQANMLVRVGKYGWAEGLRYGRSWVTNHAKRGNFWVGPLAGVDHRKTFLYFTPDPVTRMAQGPALLARGLAALEQVPSDPPADALCSRPIVSRRATTFLVGMIGIAAGAASALFVSKRYLHTP